MMDRARALPRPQVGQMPPAPAALQIHVGIAPPVVAGNAVPVPIPPRRARRNNYRSSILYALNADAVDCPAPLPPLPFMPYRKPVLYGPGPYVVGPMHPPQIENQQWNYAGPVYQHQEPGAPYLEQPKVNPDPRPNHEPDAQPSAQPEKWPIVLGLGLQELEQMVMEDNQVWAHV